MYQLNNQDTQRVQGGVFGIGIIAGIAASAITGTFLLTALGVEGGSEQFKGMFVLQSILGGTVGLLTDIGYVALLFV